MTAILAIETATSSCSAALMLDGVVSLKAEVGNNIHSRVLLSMVDSLLVSAGIGAQDLDAVAVGQGPGSFTGLRIGVGVGQGLALGGDCPMIGVSSLDALAWQSPETGTIIAAIDARMGEIYWCEYHKTANQLSRRGDLRLTPPKELVNSDPECGEVSLIGNAWEIYGDQLGFSKNIQLSGHHRLVYPSAQAVLALAEPKYLKGEGVAAAYFLPSYVRNDVAKKSNKPLPGRRQP